MTNVATGLPFDDIRILIREMPGPDHDAVAKCRAREATLTKPPGALGRLEQITEWVAAWQGFRWPAPCATSRITSSAPTWAPTKRAWPGSMTRSAEPSSSTCTFRMFESASAKPAAMRPVSSDLQTRHRTHRQRCCEQIVDALLRDQAPEVENRGRSGSGPMHGPEWPGGHAVDHRFDDETLGRDHTGEQPLEAGALLRRGKSHRVCVPHPPSVAIAKRPWQPQQHVDIGPVAEQLERHTVAHALLGHDPAPGQEHVGDHALDPAGLQLATHGVL